MSVSALVRYNLKHFSEQCRHLERKWRYLYYDIFPWYSAPQHHVPFLTNGAVCLAVTLPLLVKLNLKVLFEMFLVGVLFFFFRAPEFCVKESVLSEEAEDDKSVWNNKRIIRRGRERKARDAIR